MGQGQVQGQGESEGEEAATVVEGGPWFERAPRDVNVSLGRTLRCECVVAGEQPIGQWHVM